jgi:transaldolase
MKIFIDTANIKHIREANNLGIIDGVTTNPSLVSKENKPFLAIISEISKIVNGPISAEVISLELNGMLREARLLSRLHKNIVVKIPLTKEGIAAVKKLSQEGIKTNVTLCFSPSQALLAAKVGAAYISPFIGRLDDISQEGMNLVKDIKEIYSNYSFNTKIIVASVRHPRHVVEAALVGADIATVPYEVLMKLFDHSLTDIGIKRFLSDWEKVPEEYKKF